MILTKLKRYLMQRGHAPLSDIALHLDSDPEAVRGMLERWIRKGKIRKCSGNPSCGSGCDKCDSADVETYEWVDDTPQVVHFDLQMK
jgi:hypothetical protein